MTALHVIALGGTIASTASTDSPTDTSSRGVSPTATAEQIGRAARLDTLPAAPDVTFEQLAQVGSGSITLDILGDVVRAARRAAANGAEGIVLTQGTDTLEDSAFVLSLLNDSGIPIVLTGAMRNPTMPGADGPANVRSAALAALDPHIRRLRAVLVFDDEIHDPLTVTKAHTSSIATFTSGPALGPLGWIVEDRVVLPHFPLPVTLPPGMAVPPSEEHRHFEVSGQGSSEEVADSAFPEVVHIEVGLGDALSWIGGLPDSRVAGAVVSGVGGGHVPEWLVDPLGELAGRIPLILASRTGSGSTLSSTYGYPGAEIDLLGKGLISAGRLSARRARLLLLLALACEVDPAEAFAAFA